MSLDWVGEHYKWLHVNHSFCKGYNEDQMFREDYANPLPLSFFPIVSTRSHLWIAVEVSPVPISLYVTVGFKEVKLAQTQ
jgi:hypothetical protein